MDVFAAIADERRSVADLLEGLSPEQQDTQSLCAAWTVRQVAGHLVVPLEVGLPGFMLAMLRHRGNFDRANDALARRQAQRPFAELIDVLRAKADSRFTPPGQGAEAPLTDVLVHSLDITRPLRLERPVPHDRLVTALDHVSSPTGRVSAPGRALLACRLEAVDLDWSHGEGPVVRGPAESLLLALTGRDAGWRQLSGAVPPRP